jgi:hypothetical protein
MDISLAMASQLLANCAACGSQVRRIFEYFPTRAPLMGVVRSKANWTTKEVRKLCAPQLYQRDI